MIELWSIFTQQLNNREVAVVLWLTIVAVWLLRYESVRGSLSRLFKALLHRKILIVLLLLTAYISLLIFGLAGLGIWSSRAHLKDTIIWSVTVAFVMILNVSDVQREEGFFRKAVRDSVKFTIVLEFLVGFYPFSLPVELVLVPSLVFLGALMAVAEMDQEYASVKKVLEGLIAIVGLLLIWHSFRNLLAEPRGFLNLESLSELLLPSILTILYLPFIYALALLFAYENVFVRLKFRNLDSNLVGYAKRRLFLRFGFNLRKLTKWTRQNPDLKVTTKDDVIGLTGAPLKITDNHADEENCLISTYRQSAQPLMDQVKAVVDQIDFGDSSSRELARTHLRVLRFQVNELQCKDTFPLKHETLEFTIKHAVDALDYADNGNDVAAEQALARATLNQERFYNWNIDLN